MTDTLILCYHAFSDDWPAALSVKPDLMERQLERLAKAGYQGVTFSEAIRRQARGKEVAVTFDDAFTSVVTYAKPMLDRLGWPGTIYTVTKFADDDGAPLHWDGIDQWRDSPWADDLDSLNWAELRELRDAGWEVGSHTVNHPHLTRLGADDLDRELSESRARIEAELGEDCLSIAYPYGDVNAGVIEAAGRAGYATGAALPARWGEIGTLEWPRVGVYRPDDLRRFRIKASKRTRRVRALLGR